MCLFQRLALTRCIASDALQLGEGKSILHISFHITVFCRCRIRCHWCYLRVCLVVVVVVAAAVVSDSGDNV